jgi:pimeloyl-ACP methyl ester carboxylesterase
MRYILSLIILSGALAPMAARAQYSPAPSEPGLATKTSYVRLSNNANAILVEPVTPNEKSRFAVVVSHPGHLNNFEYFIAPGMARYGYRVLLVNYYGAMQTYYEYLGPMALAIKTMRAMPGVEKVLLVAHSTGGTEATFYQDVAENGPKACQEPVRIYKCQTKDADNLPKADALILLDANTGAPERDRKTNPAVDPHHPGRYNADLDLFSSKNGYNPTTGEANYSPEFLKKFFAAQAAQVNGLIDEAQARLAVIEKGQSDFSYDEPFLDGSYPLFEGPSPEEAYIHLLWKTHAPHKLLTPDGSNPVQIIALVKQPKMRPEDTPKHSPTPNAETVRSFLTSASVRLTPDYHWSEDNMYGVIWRSTPASLPGNIEGVHVPTLIIASTCSEHMVSLEISYDHSPAKDKEFVGLDGATHFFTPCRPEYGDTFKRGFDYVDAWLSKPGRF